MGIVQIHTMRNSDFGLVFLSMSQEELVLSNSRIHHLGIKQLMQNVFFLLLELSLDIVLIQMLLEHNVMKITQERVTSQPSTTLDGSLLLPQEHNVWLGEIFVMILRTMNSLIQLDLPMSLVDLMHPPNDVQEKYYQDFNGLQVAGFQDNQDPSSGKIETQLTDLKLLINLISPHFPRLFLKLSLIFMD